mgnify:FL=1
MNNKQYNRDKLLKSLKEAENIHLKDKEKKNQYLNEINLLKGIDLFKFINDALEEKDVDKAIKGETHSKLTGIMLCSIMSIGYKLMVVFKGSSSIGKTNLANMITSLFTIKKVGDLSPTALKYSEDDNYDILYHQETSEQESKRKSFKFISSDDGGFEAETTVKDPDTGEFTIQKTEVEAKGFVTTTTAIELDKEFSTRSFIIPLDESEEQTEKIIKYNFTESDRLIDKAEGLTNFGDKYEKLRVALSSLNLYDVIIPYEKMLRGIFPKNNLPLRTRRDSKKVTTLIKASTLLFQHQRPKVVINNKLFLVATWQDVYNVLQISLPIIDATTTEFDARTLKALNILPDIILNHGGITSKLLSSELGDITKDTARRILRQLNDKGIIYEDIPLKKEQNFKGRTKVYNLNSEKISESGNNRLHDLDWLKILEKQDEFLDKYGANRENKRDQLIIETSLVEYNKYHDIVYDPVEDDYKKISPSEKFPFKTLKTEEIESLKDSTCDNLCCNTDCTVNAPVSVKNIPFDFISWDSPIFSTYIDAEQEILKIVSTPVFLDYRNMVNVETIYDILNAMFDFTVKQVDVLIQQLIDEGVLIKPITGYLQSPMLLIKYNEPYTLIVDE